MAVHRSKALAVVDQINRKRFHKLASLQEFITFFLLLGRRGSKDGSLLVRSRRAGSLLMLSRNDAVDDGAVSCGRFSLLLAMASCS